jgi:hypothetical protein
MAPRTADGQDGDGMEAPARRKSFLIRLWQRQVGGTAGLGVLVECVATGQRRALPDLDSLVAYLQAQVEDDPGTDPASDRQPARSRRQSTQGGVP